MNKKAYITPEMEVMNVETVEMMAASNNESSIFVSNKATKADAAMTNEHRRTWGDLWN